MNVTRIRESSPLNIHQGASRHHRLCREPCRGLCGLGGKSEDSKNSLKWEQEGKWFPKTFSFLRILAFWPFNNSDSSLCGEMLHAWRGEDGPLLELRGCPSTRQTGSPPAGFRGWVSRKRKSQHTRNQRCLLPLSLPSHHGTSWDREYSSVFLRRPQNPMGTY